MGRKEKRNVGLHAGLLAALDDLVARLNSGGGQVRAAEVIAAALVGFFDLTEPEQIEFIRRARSYDLERPPQIPAAPNEVAKELHKAAGRGSAKRAGSKPKRRKAGGGCSE